MSTDPSSRVASGHEQVDRAPDDVPVRAGDDDLAAAASCFTRTRKLSRLGALRQEVGGHNRQPARTRERPEGGQAALRRARQEQGGARLECPEASAPGATSRQLRCRNGPRGRPPAGLRGR